MLGRAGELFGFGGGRVLWVVRQGNGRPAARLRPRARPRAMPGATARRFVGTVRDSRFVVIPSSSPRDHLRRSRPSRPTWATPLQISKSEVSVIVCDALFASISAGRARLGSPRDVEAFDDSPGGARGETLQTLPFPRRGNRGRAPRAAARRGRRRPRRRPRCPGGAAASSGTRAPPRGAGGGARRGGPRRRPPREGAPPRGRPRGRPRGGRPRVSRTATSTRSRPRARRRAGSPRGTRPRARASRRSPRSRSCPRRARDARQQTPFRDADLARVANEIETLRPPRRSSSRASLRGPNEPPREAGTRASLLASARVAATTSGDGSYSGAVALCACKENKMERTLFVLKSESHENSRVINTRLVAQYVH
jgi:hypothetical protein